MPAGRRFFHGRQLSSPVSSARLLRYQPVVDEVVNGRIERNARIRSLCRVDAARKSLRTHAGEGATIRDRPIVVRGKGGGGGEGDENTKGAASCPMNGC